MNKNKITPAQGRADTTDKQWNWKCGVKFPYVSHLQSPPKWRKNEDQDNVFQILGDIGNAARMQLVVNTLIGTVAAGLAESMALAEKIGLDPAEVLRVLMLSDAASSLVETKGTGTQHAKSWARDLSLCDSLR